MQAGVVADPNSLSAAQITPPVQQPDKQPPIPGVTHETSLAAAQHAAMQMGQQSVLHRTLFDKVKKGEVDEVVRMIQTHNIDCSTVIDEAKNFSQTPIFSACIIPDHDLAFRMINVLVELGIDPVKEDSLKQTPLFYAAREGNAKLIDFLCGHRADIINR